MARVFEIYYANDFETKFGDIGFRIGQLAADEDFMGMDYSDVFLNSSLGAIPNVAPAQMFSQYNVATLGLVVYYSYENFDLTLGVYNGNVGADISSNNGFDYSNTFETIAFWYQLGYNYELGGLAGRVVFGGNYHSDPSKVNFDQIDAGSFYSFFVGVQQALVNDSEGNAKLADLGIAKNINENDTVLTVEASIFGTPAYMSPEQAKDSHSVDIRSDIYSLGMVAFEMLSGRRVYQGDSMMNVLSQVLLPQEVPSVRLYNASVSEPMACLIAAMVAKDANRRPETPALVIERIKGVEDFLDEQIFNDGAFAAKPPDAHADSDANTFVPSETKTEKTVRSNAAEQRTARLKTEFRALNESAPASPAVSAAPEIDWTAGTVNKAKKQRFSLVMSVVAAVLLLSGVLLWLLFTGDASDAAGAYNAPDYASHIESDETYEQQGSSYVMLIPVGIFSFLSIMIIFAYRKL